MNLVDLYNDRIEIKDFTLLNFKNALISLEKSIVLYREFGRSLAPRNISEEFVSAQEDIFLAIRDSMVQRFKYSVSVFLKFLKFYLENYEKLEIALNSPRGVIRQSVESKLISEQEGDLFFLMIEGRNQTSHIYRQEVAELISADIPKYYESMFSLIVKLERKILEYNGKIK